MNDQYQNPEEQNEYSEYFSGDVLIGLPSEINPDAINNGELNLDEGILKEDWQKEISFGTVVQNKSLMADVGAIYEINKWSFSAS